MKVIIVGAHGEAKELINRISSGWSISVIDLDQDKLRNFSTNRQIEKIQGDATSSLVLKKAGLESTTAVITLTLNDEVNLEVLKIAITQEMGSYYGSVFERYAIREKMRMFFEKYDLLITYIILFAFL